MLNRGKQQLNPLETDHFGAISSGSTCFFFFFSFFFKKKCFLGPKRWTKHDKTIFLVGLLGNDLPHHPHATGDADVKGPGEILQVDLLLLSFSLSL